MKDTFMVVEDDQLTQLSIAKILEPFATVLSCLTASEAYLEKKFDVAIIDLDLEKPRSGFEVLSFFVKQDKYCVILTGHDEEDLIEEGYQRGCQDYFVKPVSREAIISVHERYRSWKSGQIFEKICKEQALAVPDGLVKISGTLLPLLLTGETGTGKGHLAKIIHQSSREGELVHLNCAEIPENLIESELFGYRAGAFSGATKDYQGKLSQADRGTLFLDEIATLSTSLQAKLLRVIEDKCYYPLGSNRKEKSDFRLISATCEPLEEMVLRGTFRKDLYYRLAGFHYHLPPLRENISQIDQWIKSMVGANSRRMIFKEEAISFMKRYEWPGNFRQLKRVIEKLIMSGGGIITVDLISQYIRLSKISPEASRIDYVKEHGLNSYMTRVKRDVVSEIVKENNGAVRKSLRQLQISNSMYYNIIKEREDG